MVKSAAEVYENEVERLRLRAHRMARAQYLQAKALRRWKNRLGVPAAVLSAVAGTSAFAAIANDGNTATLVASGTISVLSAALVGLQTFLGLSERSEKHRGSAAAYAAKKRELDLLLANLRAGEKINEIGTNLEVHVNEINALERNSHDVHDIYYDQARNEQIEDSEGV